MEGRNRTLIIAIVIVALLCCCCVLLASGWFYGDAVLDFLGM